MKLTSRALKVGDIVIRKYPTNTGDESWMGIPLMITKKGRYHTTANFSFSKNFSNPTENIFAHFIWNDDNWVRYK